MARLPTRCRLCGVHKRDGHVISWAGLCPPCGESEVRTWAVDNTDITGQRYWEIWAKRREGIRRRQLLDIQATIAAYPDLA